MKILVQLRLRGCQIEFVEKLGPGIVAIGEIEIDGADAHMEEVMPAIKARMLDQLFEIEYLVKEAPKLLDLQRYEGPAVIYVQ